MPDQNLANEEGRACGKRDDAFPHAVGQTGVCLGLCVRLCVNLIFVSFIFMNLMLPNGVSQTSLLCCRKLYLTRFIDFSVGVQDDFCSFFANFLCIDLNCPYPTYIHTWYPYFSAQIQLQV